jgi:hypothetical protein
MNRTVVTVSLICALLLIGSTGRSVKVAAQTQTRCVAYVPADWGTYKGASESYGLAFEDSQGNLRCGTCKKAEPMTTLIRVRKERAGDNYEPYRALSPRPYPLGIESANAVCG